MLATIATRKTIASKAIKTKAAAPTRIPREPAIKSARRSMTVESIPLPRNSDGQVWFGIGDQRSPAVQPDRNEDMPIDTSLGVQQAKSGGYLTPRMQGEYGDRARKNLYVITRDGMKIAPELTPIDSARGIITHTNLAPSAAVVAGELWASATTPWLWKINSGSKRFPLQDALVFNDKKLLWEAPPKGTPERACLDKQWEAVAVYMLSVGAAVVMQPPLDQRFEKKLDFKMFVREDILQQEMEIFMRFAPSEWKKVIKHRLQQAEAAQFKAPAEPQLHAM
jgi:hypothetical protein